MGRNKNSGHYMLGASNRSEREREQDDFYATPYIATRKLLEKLKEHNIVLPKRIVEPAVGMGHIAKVLEEAGYEVSCIDIVDRKWPNTKIVDFLKETSLDGDAIVTNPPYSGSYKFIEKSLELLQDDQFCIMLLKLQFLEGKERYKKLYSNGLNPKNIFIFSSRINCAKGGNFKEENELFENATNGFNTDIEAESANGGQICYIWAVWQKGYKGQTVVDWIA